MMAPLAGSLGSAWAPGPQQVLLTCTGSSHLPCPQFLQASSLRAFSSRSVEDLCSRLLVFMWRCSGETLLRAKQRSDKWWHVRVHGRHGVEGHREETQTGKFWDVSSQLVNPNNLTVMKWKVCGEKQMLWLLQCYYVHKIYFIWGEFTQGVMRFLLYTLFITA